MSIKSTFLTFINRKIFINKNIILKIFELFNELL